MALVENYIDDGLQNLQKNITLISPGKIVNDQDEAVKNYIQSVVTYVKQNPTKDNTGNILGYYETETCFSLGFKSHTFIYI